MNWPFTLLLRIGTIHFPVISGRRWVSHGGISINDCHADGDYGRLFSHMWQVYVYRVRVRYSISVCM